MVLGYPNPDTKPSNPDYWVSKKNVANASRPYIPPSLNFALWPRSYFINFYPAQKVTELTNLHISYDYQFSSLQFSSKICIAHVLYGNLTLKTHISVLFILSSQVHKYNHSNRSGDQRRFHVHIMREAFTCLTWRASTRAVSEALRVTTNDASVIYTHWSTRTVHKRVGMQQHQQPHWIFYVRRTVLPGATEHEHWRHSSSGLLLHATDYSCPIWPTCSAVY